MTDITTPAQMREAVEQAVLAEKMRIMSWCAKRQAVSRKAWERAARKALAGDMAELRNRIALIDAGPLDIVQSDAGDDALPVSEPEPLAVRVKPLVWEETHDDRGDGSSEHNGCYEASTALGVYEIGMGFGSDAYYWSACDPNYNEIGSFEDPSYAQAAAEADHAALILSQIDAVSVAQVRAEALEEAAAKFSGLAVLRKMWSASEVEAAIRALMEKPTR